MAAAAAAAELTSVVRMGNVVPIVEPVESVASTPPLSTFVPAADDVRFGPTVTVKSL
jgi:hypothetical protein